MRYAIYHIIEIIGFSHIQFFQTAYGMCETFVQAVTTLGTTHEDEESMLESRLYPKLNTEVISALSTIITDIILN